MRPAVRNNKLQKLSNNTREIVPVHCDQQQSNASFAIDYRNSAITPNNAAAVYSKPALKSVLRGKSSMIQKYSGAVAHSSYNVNDKTSRGNSSYNTVISKPKRFTNFSHVNTTRQSIETEASNLLRARNISVDTESRLTGQLTINPQTTKGWTKTDLLNTIETALENAAKNFEEFEGLTGKFKTTHEKLVTIDKENAMIRYHLRTLNDLLSVLLPFKNQELYKRKPSLRKINTEENTDPGYIQQVVSQNYDKWFGYYKTDFEHYQKRLDEIKDPVYQVKISNRISELDKLIHDYKKRILHLQDQDKIYKYVFFITNYY